MTIPDTVKLVEVLRGLKEGEGELARFLRAHSLLMHAPRDEVNPLLLSAPFWPGPEDAPDLTARVFVGRVCEEDGRRYWQVGFGVEGSRLGFVGGAVESGEEALISTDESKIKI